MNTDSDRTIDIQRRTVSKKLDQQRRSELGQFMTPSGIADFMSNQFKSWPKEVDLLDPGAGLGALSESFVRQFNLNSGVKSKLSITAYEIDDLLSFELEKNLGRFGTLLEEKSLNFNVIKSDFISHSGQEDEVVPKFTHVILNPPYKKIPANSKHRTIMRKFGVETPNLYAAFLALSVMHSKKDAEIVAIIPRSFCNGTYFKSFREWLIRNSAITHIHSFDSRKTAFKDDAVLQENVIIKIIKGGKQGEVTISKIEEVSFSKLNSYKVPFNRVVETGDREMYIRVPDRIKLTNSILTHTLKELNLNVSTGQVVDFRSKEHLLANPDNESVPLLYPHHFSGNKLNWPKEHKKPNAIRINTNTSKLLMPKGWYLVVNRFTSKEESKRLVANVVNPELLPYDWYGFENHVNVIHFNKEGLSAEIVWGLYVFLNSSEIDNHFRTFSGHTQVNATDLKNMMFPSKDVLLDFGKWAKNKATLTQGSIDGFIEQYASKQTAKSNK